MTSRQEPAVNLWVKAEPFSYGAFPIAPHPRLTISNIKKIVIYAKNKGEAGFPKISYSVWRHIACNKLHLSESLAWMYFSRCHFLSENTSVVERLEWDHNFADSSKDEKENMKNQVSVVTFKFVLYLYIQQLHKVSLKASLVAGDEWPTRSSSPDMDGRSTPRNSNKSLDDHSHMVFVHNNLHEILDLLVEPDNDSGYPGDVGLSHLAVEALGFLLAGSMDRCKTLMPLQDIATLQTLQHRSGYSKMKKTFSVRLFQTWIKDCLVQNPFGISACIASGRRLSWPMAGQDKDGLSETKRGRIATNAHAVPKEHMKGNKIIIMSQVGKQTVARSSSTLENSCVKIHRCHSAYIYLLSPLRSVTIEKCRNSTIVLGPVECAVFLSHCESVTLIACARTVLISSSTLCTLHLLTPNPPAILSGNDSLTLAPYHTYYPKLEEHMAEVGIGAERNLWDEPICVGPDHKEDSPVWEIMPVQDFFTFNIPFEMEGTTKSIPGGLPGKYQRAVNQRYKQIDSWQKTVKESGLTRDQRKEFQSLVESRFHVWLSESGHKRELDSLVLPQQGKKSQ
ncbi:hypothetical protein ACJMK2_011872 [Sinanodonta woodiana]|uniref:TBCC domain-containing protein 1 n=1 Tax=Sinanodonta woodiana TaxID=1069815 RepID=A0ABD3V6E4_SINWO